MARKTKILHLLKTAGIFKNKYPRMTSYRTRSNGSIQILQYLYVETKKPLFFFMKNRKKEIWCDVPANYIDNIDGHDKFQDLYGTINSSNTDLAAFMTKWSNVYDYLREVYGPKQYELQESAKVYQAYLQEEKVFKYKY